MNKLNQIVILFKFDDVINFFLRNCRQIWIIQLLIVFLVTTSTAFAVPLISTVTHQTNSLAITGANFGIDQSVTTPIFWDNFDSGTNGDNLVTQLAGSVPWTFNTQPTAKYSTTQAHSGSQSAYALHKNGLHWSHFTVGERSKPIPDSLTYYQTFWFRFNTPRPLGTVGETKLIRIFGSDPQQILPDRPFVKSGGVGNWWTTSYAKAYDGLEPYKNWVNQSPTENTWHRIEAMYKQSSVGGTADGSIQLVLDGVVQATFSKIITRSASTDRWIKVDFFSGMTNWDTANTGFTWEKWVDDAYLSKTWQRVEVCDTPTWAARTHCEMQLATEWGEGQIKVNYNPGSFASDQIVYVYVSDSSGVVNSDGFKLSMGAPAAPKNVIKIPNK